MNRQTISIVRQTMDDAKKSIEYRAGISVFVLDEFASDYEQQLEAFAAMKGAEMPALLIRVGN